jgi:hypothetical protein
VVHDSRHERFGLPPERPALFARQFRTTTAFIDQYPRLFLGEGRRQLDCTTPSKLIWMPSRRALILQALPICSGENR